MFRFWLYIFVAFLVTWGVGYALVKLIGPVGFAVEVLFGLCAGYVAASLARPSRRY